MWIDVRLDGTKHPRGWLNHGWGKERRNKWRVGTPLLARLTAGERKGRKALSRLEKENM